MRRLARKIVALIPKRRRRMWKYVSPQRRRLGLLVLALLVAMIYAGWYFTNPSRIRRQAKKTLEALTGADVDVDAASFRLFEGIRLHGVRVRIREDDSPRHFFTAKEVVMKHRPWSLLFHGRIEPTDIVCLEPVVTIEYDKDAGESNAEKLFIQASSRQRQQTNIPRSLPRILLKDGKLRSLVKERGRRGPLVEEPFNATLRPVSKDSYEVTVQGPRDGLRKVEWAKLILDVSTGKIQPISWSASERWFNHLPPKYQEWIKRYNLRGNFNLAEGPNTKPEEGLYEIDLKDFSLKLPDSEGGFSLSSVQGMLRFSRDGVEIKNVAGRVNEAGNAQFTLNGEYQGYEKSSPFRVNISLHGVSLPEQVTGSLEKMVSFLKRKFQPRGKTDISLEYRRDEKGGHFCEGVIEPKGISMVFDKFPLPGHNVRGKIYFNQDGVNRIDLTAERGNASFQITGTVEDHEKYTLYDITVVGDNCQFDKALHDALPKRYQGLWKELNPAGRSNVRVHVYRNSLQEDLEIEVDLKMKGLASVNYDGFAYPLKNLDGEVTLRGNTVRIPLIRSKNGQMQCEIEGIITDVNTKNPQIDLSITATQVPLDQTLINALKGRTKKLLTSLSLSGTAEEVKATVRKVHDQPLDYKVTATIKDASFRYDRFPYLVSNAAGNITITPQKAVIHSLKARRGEAKIRMDGWIALDKEELDCDLTFEAENVLLDEDFRAVLPPKVQEVWDSLSPAGRTNINMQLKTAGRTDGDGTYRLILDAKDMTIRYRDFPYTFRGVTGRAVVSPGHVHLEEMKARHGDMTATISGDIRSTAHDGTETKLSISARNVLIDKELLAAIPSEIVPLAKQFSPGGRFNAEIENFTFRRKGPTTQPATGAPSNRPSPKSADVSWIAEGRVGFRDVSVDIGFGPRSFTGEIQGKAFQQAQKLGVEADVQLTRLKLGNHEVTDVRGRLSKSPKGNVLRVEKIDGKVHDGRLAGEAVIRLTDPIHYSLSISVENVDLAKLFNAGVKDREKWVEMNGLLAGQLVLIATGGEHPVRQAIGELEITRGRMYKLPVILGLLNVVYLSLPGDSAFNSGFIRYHLKNDKLELHEIFLTGKEGTGISILGSGTLNMKTDELKLTFLTGPPGRMPRLSELADDILGAIRGELVEIRVTGKLKDPKFTSVPLRSLDRIIRRLTSIKTE